MIRVIPYRDLEKIPSEVGEHYRVPVRAEEVPAFDLVDEVLTGGSSSRQVSPGAQVTMVLSGRGAVRTSERQTPFDSPCILIAEPDTEFEILNSSNRELWMIRITFLTTGLGLPRATSRDAIAPVLRIVQERLHPS